MILVTLVCGGAVIATLVNSRLHSYFEAFAAKVFVITISTPRHYMVEKKR